jgi:hypothetical protein
MCIGDDLLTGFDQLLGVPQVSRHRQPHLINHVEHPLTVDHEISADGKPSRLYYQFLERINQFEDL